MGMNKVPTLVLGIGGIGCRIAADISDLLSKEDRKYVGIIGIDTNVNDLKQLEKRNIRTIQTSDSRKVGEYLQMHPEYLTWFPCSKFTAGKTMVNGAGQIRAVSRMAALASEENGMFLPIKEEIKRIRMDNGNLTVMVVGSITGGTGAGLFLQIPYYVRSIMGSESGLKDIIVRGMFLGPDLTADVQPSKINRNAVRVNGYSCLKELNAVYMSQTHSAPAGGQLKIDFYTQPNKDEQKSIAEDMRRALLNNEDYDEDIDLEALREDTETIALGNPNIPYDYLYLLEGSHVKGTIGNASLKSIEGLAARMVFTLMFSPVSDNALSVEDNMVLQDMEKGGMNRYSSAGITRLIYPKELAHDYVTLTTVRDLVRDEWMVIDDAYTVAVATARDEQRTNGNVKIPKLKDFFVSSFTDKVSGGGRLGRLYTEAFAKIPPLNTEISKADFYFDWIDAELDSVTNSDKVKAAKNGCSLDGRDMRTFEAAQDSIVNVYSSLNSYRELAENLVAEKAPELSNNLFPTSLLTLRQNKADDVDDVYKLLHNVHPLTARFLAYDIINRLEEDIEDLEGEVTGMNLDSYLKTDFDEKEDETQTAQAALENIKDRKIPVVGALVSDARRIKKLKSRLYEVVTVQQGLITNYLEKSLRLAVYRILLKRMTRLAENYAAFFSSVSTMIKDNNTRIETLEELNMPVGMIGVYCSKDAFQSMAGEYKNRVDSELPEATKTAIFEELFDVLATEFSYEGTVETERQKEVRSAQKAEALSNIFQTAVINTVRLDVLERGDEIINFNIKKALEKQYDLECPEDLDLTAYLQQTIEKAMEKAAPMISTSANSLAENTESVYLAIHPDCAENQLGKPSVSATQALLLPQACAATDNITPTFIMEDDFSPYEITCFKARYKFSIEDLTKYAVGSDNEIAYGKRIKNIGKTPSDPNDPDAYKTVVSPHLNRYWHEEAYLPSIYSNVRRRDRINLQKEFFYGVGRDFFVRQADEVIDDEAVKAPLYWYLSNGFSAAPIKVRGKRIGRSYTDLYNALPFNGEIKRNILKISRKMMETEKSFYSAQEMEEKIFDNEFINDIIQPTLDLNNDGVLDIDQSGEGNLLDILAQMRDTMNHDEWKALFTGLKETLWEFCGFMFDQNERIVNKTVKAIMTKMFENSKLGGKDQTTFVTAEREIKELVDMISNSVYTPQ